MLSFQWLRHRIRLSQWNAVSSYCAVLNAPFSAEQRVEILFISKLTFALQNAASDKDQGRSLPLVLEWDMLLRVIFPANAKIGS